MVTYSRLVLLWLLCCVGILPTGCVGDDPALVGGSAPLTIQTAPGRLVFDAKTSEIAVKVTNNTDADVFVSDFRIEGPDWESFMITDDVGSSALAKGVSVELHIRSQTADFVGGLRPSAVAAEHLSAPAPAPDSFREGSAKLVFGVAQVRRPDDVQAQTVPIRFEESPWWMRYALPAAAKILLLVMAFIMPLASFLTWLERKQSAMMQDRVGPNMANISLGPLKIRLWGLLHVATDGLKMLFKEDFIPKRAHRALYTLAPLFGLIPALVVFAIVPFGDAVCYDGLFDTLTQADVDQCAAGRGGTPMQIAHIDVGLLYYFAIASIATYGTVLAGWSSYNKWAVLGALRASAQMISYEVAIGLSLVGTLLVYGSLEPHTIVHAQMDTYWGIVLQPIALVLFFTAAIAETKRAPFDLPEADSEIIGYFLEYSGMRFGLFFLAEFIEVVFVSALITTLFLGGWTLPFGVLGASGFSSALACQVVFALGGLLFTVLGVAIWRAHKNGEFVGALVGLAGLAQLLVAGWSAVTGWGTELPHLAIVLIGMLTWGGKILMLCWLQLLIRWTLPRFRYDQVMSLGWKGLLPLSIANIVLTAVVVYFMMGSLPA